MAAVFCSGLGKGLCCLVWTSKKTMKPSEELVWSVDYQSKVAGSLECQRGTGGRPCPKVCHAKRMAHHQSHSDKGCLTE